MRITRYYPMLLLLVCACGSRSPSGTAKGTTEPAPMTKPASTIPAILHMALEFQAVPRKTPPQTQISVVETNEMGSNTRHNLGEFDGECQDVTLDVRLTDPEVFLAFHCQPFEDQRGVLVHLLKRRGRLVLLRAWLGATKPTFDEFDQIGELPPYRSGVPILSDYDEAP